MNKTDQFELTEIKRVADAKIKFIQYLEKRAEGLTGEADMTADYIWGNCTLEQLLAHLGDNAPVTK